MRSVKILFLFAVMAMSTVLLKAQASKDNSLANFLKTKYTKDQVYDVQRSPAYPSAGKDWTLSGLKNALDATGGPIDWGTGRYLMFALETNPMKGNYTYIDDANNSGKPVSISLQLFEANGKLVKVVAKWGKIIGFGTEGCMYEVEGRYGSFFSSVPVNASSMVKYKPGIAVVTKLSELGKGSDVAKIEDAPKAISGSPFFSLKFTKEQVWDAQRMPAMPSAGKDWTLSKFKNALEATGSAIDWGTGRYLMFSPEAKPLPGSVSLMDDVNGNGQAINVSLKLYESNGTLVKVVAKWGKIIGMGAEGCMYVVEGRYGSFFSSVAINASTVVKYQPVFADVTKISDLGKGNFGTKQSESPIAITPSKPAETPAATPVAPQPASPQGNGALDFFGTKFYKNQVWEVSCDPVEPADGQEMTVTVKGPALKPAREETKPLDWGKNGDRYLMFYVNKGGSFIQITDDIKNDTLTLISAKLYERNGTVVDEPYYCGWIRGLGTSGVVYGIREPDIQFDLYLSANAIKQNDVVTYKPFIGIVKKLSQLMKGKFVTQQEQLKTVLAEKGGVTNAQFNPKVTYGSMTDQAGNTYKTVKIGNQTWMAENLRVTKYRNGEAIPIVNLSEDWNNELKTGACCSYKNTMDKNKIATYGLLYNWFAVGDQRNIAPAGWHVPTDADWTTLTTTLGGEELAGLKLKEAGTSHWLSPNTGTTNESGFTAIPLGERDYEDGRFGNQGSIASYWSITKEKATSVFYRSFNNEDGICNRDNNPFMYGFAVRLVKD
ncbi:MAG: fibrobacter succinogenes major paralogous domain-containing protein [Mariniphaga sp.]